MTKEDIKKLLNIPKKHTLRHYVKLVGKLYGEDEQFLEEYTEAVVKENEHQLDVAIECFQGLIKKEEIIKVKEQDDADTRSRFASGRNKPSILNPIGVKKPKV